MAAPKSAQVEVAENATRAKAAADNARCLFPLVPFEPRQSFEMYYVEIDPGTVFSGEPHQGDVFEYVFVLSGAIRISIEDNDFEIKAGEFLQFQANIAHQYGCISPDMASAIMQISYL